MTRITAAVCTEFGQPLQLEELDLRAPEAGEIEVTLEAVAICHSDIHFAEGAWGGDLPAVYGHEAAGRISAIGPSVRGLAEGQRVVVTLIKSCGTCPNCASGKPTICETPGTEASPLSRLDGAPVVQAMNCGAFAERVVVDQSQVVPLPDDMPPEAVALMACGVITGVGAVVNAGHLRAGEDVVVIGAGGVGLNAIQGARIAGARRIVAVDMTEDKLETAKAFGATDGVLATGKAPWKQVTRILGRGADLVAVTVGAIPAYNTALRYMGWGGRMVMIGMPHSGAMAEYEPVVLAYMAQGMVGSKMGDVVIRRDIPWLADLYRQDRLKLDELVSGRWSLDQINEAIANTKAGDAKRNVILF
ncbi:alcohol dehydrogenase catalytic domain-containing protein [Marivita sp. XM-24bin2]|jgi:S-(hydroxymethyl)mycothiol dehydrogenase|uniref:alcohol dehydrogenase catalytic domain-containing protein n=1 Tax=unclassified Marivita TaxID=2632480 RepID=UPI000D794A94|nr:alcohol dehydrogenase catalytic domain-containing protein [Marivita sp. XM-24bin2]MCR9111144.1 alcohol dehydrogenase catalytic domain-containing protein [Paracoccaceae bacterium]PWL36455.1 MAG: zinc-binding dehydrogenase [Marivita sp. XM-24bin2]